MKEEGVDLTVIGLMALVVNSSGRPHEKPIRKATSIRMFRTFQINVFVLSANRSTFPSPSMPYRWYAVRIETYR